jgi:hypothetical protein
MDDNIKINRREIGSGDENAIIRRDFENWQWPLRILKSKEVLELNNCEQLQGYPKLLSERGEPTLATY